MSFRRRILELAFFSDTHATRFTLGLAELIWACSLWWPGDTFARPTYEAMSDFASEDTWALMFFLTAVAQFSILLVQRYHNRVAVLFSAWNSALWWYVVISMYVSVYPPPAGISGELALAVAASWVFVKSGYIGICKE